MIKIAIFALIALVIIMFLRQYQPEYAIIATIISGAIIFIFIATQLYSPLYELIDMLKEYGINEGLTEYILKALGICIITKFSADLCTDFGQSSLSGKVEMAGKVALLILSIPIMKNILNIGLSLL